jgi:hypothetical protein
MSERLYPKILKFCTEASLSETSLWPKFQVKIRNYNFLRKIRVIKDIIHQKFHISGKTAQDHESFEGHYSPVVL